MAVNPNVTTDTGNNAQYPFVWARKKMLEILRAQLRFQEAALKETLPKGSGNTVRFFRPVDLSPITSALTEGVPPSGVVAPVEKVDAVPLQFGNYVAYSDYLDLTSITPLMQRLSDVIDYNAVYSLDTITRIALHENLLEYFANGTQESDVNTPLSMPDFNTISTRLDGLNVQRFSDDCFYAIIHPFVAGDLRVDTGSGSWLEINKNISLDKTHKQVLAGEIGQANGIKFMQSTNVSTGTGDAVTTYRSWVFGRECFGAVDAGKSGVEIINKAIGSAGSLDPLNQFGTLGWKSNYVAVVLDANRGYEAYGSSNQTPA